jgi:hypothetical protein
MQDDYKHTAYDNKYKINQAISLISRSTCTQLNSWHKIKDDACNFLTEITRFKIHVII